MRLSWAGLKNTPRSMRHVSETLVCKCLYLIHATEWTNTYLKDASPSSCHAACRLTMLHHADHMNLTVDGVTMRTTTERPSSRRHPITVNRSRNTVMLRTIGQSQEARTWAAVQLVLHGKGREEQNQSRTHSYSCALEECLC